MESPVSASLRQVAAASGVSLQTASRILRQQGHLHRPETCAKVLQAAQELNYRPNLISRALSAARTNTLGLIARGLGGAMNIWRIRQFIQAARERKYLTFTINLDGPGSDDTAVIEAAQDLLDRRVDGIMILRSLPLGLAARRFLDALPIPVVYLGWGPPRSRRRIVFDTSSGVSAIAAHLHALGHQQVAVFPTVWSRDYPEQWVTPNERAYARLGMKLTVPYDWAIDNDLDSGRDAVVQAAGFLRQVPQITALVLGDDLSALAAMAAARQLGLRVPEDLSVVGFGDLLPASVAQPALTTTRGPRGEVGRQAFAMLERLIDNPAAPVAPVVCPFTLVQRASTGAVRASA